MRQFRFAIMVILGTGLVASCGDKLDPVTAEEDTTVDTGTSPVVDGNTASPNAVNPNTAPATSGGNTVTPANPNTPQTGGNTTVPPTTSAKLCGTNDTKISYATHIAPLVTTTCSSCHGGGGGFSPTMTTLSNTKSAFTDRGAGDQIESGAMPQGRTLTANQLCLFKTWSTTNYSP